MPAKRPERKETGEWAKHLRPKRKREAWKAERRAVKDVVKKSLKGEHDEEISRTSRMAGD